MPDSDGQIRVGIKVVSHDARQRYMQTNFPKPMVTESTPPTLECLLIGGVGIRAVHDAGTVAMRGMNKNDGGAPPSWNKAVRPKCKRTTVCTDQLLDENSHVQVCHEAMPCDAKSKHTCPTFLTKTVSGQISSRTPSPASYT